MQLLFGTDVVEEHWCASLADKDNLAKHECYIMKWSLLLFLLPLLSAAQGVKRNQYDVFLKKQTIELEPVTLVADATNRLAVIFSSQAADLFLQVRGAGWGATTIDEGDELQFLFSNDSVVNVRSVQLQSFEPGPGKSTYSHQYHLTPAAVQALSRYDLVGLRKYSFKEATNLRLPREQGSRLKTASALFLSELKKAAANKQMKDINAHDVLNFIGDSVRLCSRVYNVRRSSTSGKPAVVLELQTSFSDPIVYAFLDNTTLVGSDGGLQFADKELCLTGMLTLRDGVPTITVVNAAQLQPKTTAE